MAEQLPTNPAFAFWEMWMTTQRNYAQMLQQALTSRRDIMPIGDRFGERFNERFAERNRNEQRVVSGGQSEQIIPIGEEALEVSTRRVTGGTTRVRRVVRERPVERQVELHDEAVVVERKAPNGETADVDSLVEREYAMSDSREVPVVTKQTRLRGHVVLRKHTNNRVEVVREVVRYADVEIEQPERMPVVAMRHEQPRSAESQDGQKRRESEMREEHHEEHHEHHETREENRPQA